MISTLSGWRAVTGLLLCASVAGAAAFPDPVLDDKSPIGDLFKGDQTAVLAAGCFWCTEAVFRQIAGIEQVVSGYSGGDAATAHYDLVSTGKTGHAESVRITYNPRKISYGALLKVFFEVAHDPTQRDRQGPDIGPQYRSVIFYSTATQKRIAEAYIRQLTEARVFPAPIVTDVLPLKAFYPAEAYHQNYCSRHPKERYVVEEALPKVEKARRQMPELIRK